MMLLLLSLLRPLVFTFTDDGVQVDLAVGGGVRVGPTGGGGVHADAVTLVARTDVPMRKQFLIPVLTKFVIFFSPPNLVGFCIIASSYDGGAGRRANRSSQEAGFHQANEYQ